MTVPVFTPTPVITPAGAADMPTALGSQIGNSANYNFSKTQDWGNQLEQELKVRAITPPTAFATPATNFTVNAVSWYIERGKMATLSLVANRVSGAAIGTATTGGFAAITVATLIAPYRPTYVLCLWSRCTGAPMLNTYINTAGAVVIRGSIAISYTYPATWALEFEARWVMP
jgi:hypothetical protein